MKFRNWVKKNSYLESGQGEVIDANKVLRYIKDKKGEPYDTVR